MGNFLNFLELNLNSGTDTEKKNYIKSPPVILFSIYVCLIFLAWIFKTEVVQFLSEKIPLGGQVRSLGSFYPAFTSPYGFSRIIEAQFYAIICGFFLIALPKLPIPQFN